jgi:hypothetical protein
VASTIHRTWIWLNKNSSKRYLFNTSRPGEREGTLATSIPSQRNIPLCYGSINNSNELRKLGSPSSECDVIVLLMRLIRPLG